MRVLLIHVRKGVVHAHDTDGNLYDLQALVDGHIEPVHIPQLADQGMVLIVNEEGVLRGLPLNENLFPFFFVGRAFIVGVSGSEFTSLTDKQLDYCRAWLSGLKE